MVPCLQIIERMPMRMNADKTQSGPAEPQSKAKKTRATPKKVQIQEQPAEPSPNGGSPTIVGEGTEAASSEIGSQDYGYVWALLRFVSN